MDVSDVQVSDKDGFESRSITVKASRQDRERAKLKGSILVSPARLRSQPLEIDTDAQLHKERVISVRIGAEFASRILPEKCPRWNADTLESSCRCDVEEFSGD